MEAAPGTTTTRGDHGAGPFRIAAGAPRSCGSRTRGAAKVDAGAAGNRGGRARAPSAWTWRLRRAGRRSVRRAVTPSSAETRPHRDRRRELRDKWKAGPTGPASTAVGRASSSAARPDGPAQPGPTIAGITKVHVRLRGAGARAGKRRAWYATPPKACRAARRGRTARRFSRQPARRGGRRRGRAGRRPRGPRRRRRAAARPRAGRTRSHRRSGPPPRAADGLSLDDYFWSVRGALLARRASRRAPADCYRGADYLTNARVSRSSTTSPPFRRQG